MPALFPIPEEQNLITIVDEGRSFLLHPEAAKAWQRLKANAEADGVKLFIVSAFRSLARQNEIIEGKRRRGIPEAEIFAVNARAGFSEHHSGRAIDIGSDGYASLEEVFEQSEAFGWLQINGSAFGFSLSYPRGNAWGIAYEPWHWLHGGRLAIDEDLG